MKIKKIRSDLFVFFNSSAFTFVFLPLISYYNNISLEIYIFRDVKYFINIIILIMNFVPIINLCIIYFSIDKKLITKLVEIYLDNIISCLSQVFLHNNNTLNI